MKRESYYANIRKNFTKNNKTFRYRKNNVANQKIFRKV